MKLKIYIVSFFIYCFVAMGFLYYLNKDTVNVFNELEKITTSLKKKNLDLSEMADSARKRSLILVMMLDEEDPFVLDEYAQQMSDQAARFIKGRDDISLFALTELEQIGFDKALEVVRSNSELQRHAIDLLLSGQAELAHEVVFSKTLPLQDKLIDAYRAFSLAVAFAAEADEKTLKNKILYNWYAEVALTMLSLLVVGFFLFSVLHHASSAETARQEAEQHAADAEREKTKADKANLEKSRFLANMSHELRTPMHAIQSFTVLALRRVKDDKTSEYLNRVAVSAKRLTGLLNNLLDLSKLEAKNQELQLGEYDLIDVIKQSFDEVNSLFTDRQLQMIWRMPESLHARFDRGLITQVMINLFSNAIKFSPDRGRIVVEVSETECLQIVVKDQGIGIPQSEVESIFDMFVQSSKSRSGAGGTGLGLAICREIIDLHQGQIWAVSPVDDADFEQDTTVVGTAFYFQIPKSV